MASSYRLSRINEEMTRTLAEIIRGVKDRRVCDCIVSVTGVTCAPDLSTARVFYSYIGGGSEKDVADGLKSATGYIRGQLAKILDLRQTPQLVFIRDDSIENGAHINKILRGITYSPDNDATENNTTENDSTEN